MKLCQCQPHWGLRLVGMNVARCQFDIWCQKNIWRNSAIFTVHPFHISPCTSAPVSIFATGPPSSKKDCIILQLQCETTETSEQVQVPSHLLSNQKLGIGSWTFKKNISLALDSWTALVLAPSQEQHQSSFAKVQTNQRTELRNQLGDRLKPKLVGPKGGQAAYSIAQLIKFMSLHPASF